jgi:hypothetical protein
VDWFCAHPEYVSEQSGVEVELLPEDASWAYNAADAANRQNTADTAKQFRMALFSCICLSLGKETRSIGRF